MGTELDLVNTTSSKVLIVDSDTTSRLKWSRMLEIMGYKVCQAGSADEALAQLELATIDLAFFDLPVPDMSDPELLQQSRKLQPEMLIVVQNSKPTIESTVAAIKVGAVDYLIGLADSKRVVDTITDALRRRARESERQNERLSRQFEEYLARKGIAQESLDDELSSDRQLLTYGQFHLDRVARRLSSQGSTTSCVELTKGEVDVLATLMSSPGVVLSCQEIVRRAFRYQALEKEAQSVIRPYISRLRRKFDVVGLERDLIITIRGRGYVFAKTP